MAAIVHPDLHDAAAALLDRYREVRAATQHLRMPLSAEDQMVQSMPDCSPAKWHAAHTTWFFETFILSGEPSYKPFDERFRVVYNSYYKQLGQHPFRGDRGTFSRPSVEEVDAYREYVDSAMERLLISKPRESVLSLVELGLQHEQQHQELILTDIKHAFWSQPLRPAYADDVVGQSSRAVPPAGLVPRDGGLVEIGHSGPGFAFDNESPRHNVFLYPFVLENRLITNAEYLQFIDDGGYRKPELWLSDGWDAVCRLHWEAPLYWERVASGVWHYFTLSGMRNVDPGEPVCHVSFYEADAYARWAGARLPLETEWEHAAALLPVEGNFVESRQFHPAAASKGDALHQMFGDVWEWTASAYLGYPGFKPAAGAVGEYNAKFMCNQFVLRGGSCATPRSHIRSTYRNFFPPHARWQFSGIRLARTVEGSR